MKRILIDFDNPEKEDIVTIAAALKMGLVIAYPTDTIYGLGCLAADSRAVRKIRRIKQREAKKPMLVLVNSMVMLKRYFVVSSKQAAYLKKVWPGPVSVILRQKGRFPLELSGGLQTVAARLPKNDFLDKIMSKAGGPIVSTSLNLSQRKNLVNVKNIGRYFKSVKPDLVIDIGRDLKGKPSRLIDLSDPSAIRILRP